MVMIMLIGAHIAIIFIHRICLNVTNSGYKITALRNLVGQNGRQVTRYGE